MGHDLNTVSILSSEQNPGVKMLYKMLHFMKQENSEFLYKAHIHVNAF